MAKLPMMGTAPLAGMADKAKTALAGAKLPTGMADKAKTALAGAKPMGDMGAKIKSGLGGLKSTLSGASGNMNKLGSGLTGKIGDAMKGLGTGAARKTTTAPGMTASAARQQSAVRNANQAVAGQKSAQRLAQNKTNAAAASRRGSNNTGLWSGPAPASVPPRSTRPVPAPKPAQSRSASGGPGYSSTPNYMPSAEEMARNRREGAARINAMSPMDRLSQNTPKFKG